ncbi:MAG TPA: DUF6249 domain-containing protein [Ktedonobacteraceae bacterium]|jgi:hypothetical protein
MSFNVLMVLIGWLVAMAIFFGFIVMLRYLHHRETMALISHGINPELRRRRSRGMLRAGLIITMVGLALTIGLYPVGFFLPPIFMTPFHLGPWLLPGLIPLGVGIALIGSYYLEQNAPISGDETHDNVIPMKDHQERKQKEKY